jgi:hypothetical protein
MGEYADMMLDGTLCACCGDFIGEDAGYPIYCSEACEPDGYAEAMGRPTPASEAKRERRRRYRRNRAKRRAAERAAEAPTPEQPA